MSNQTIMGGINIALEPRIMKIGGAHPMKFRQLRKALRVRYVMLRVPDAEGPEHLLYFDLDDANDRRKLRRYDYGEVTAIGTATRTDGGEPELLVTIR